MTTNSSRSRPNPSGSERRSWLPTSDHVEATSDRRRRFHRSLEFTFVIGCADLQSRLLCSRVQAIAQSAELFDFDVTRATHGQTISGTPLAHEPVAHSLSVHKQPHSWG